MGSSVNLKGYRRKAVVILFKVLSSYLPGGTEENNKISV
jgi:hypothetical protein